MSSICSTRRCLYAARFTQLRLAPTRSQTELPPNSALVQIPSAIARAHHAYVRRRQEEDGEHAASNAITLFVVQPGERNSTDQRWLEYTLWETHGVRVERCTLGGLHDRARLDS